MFFVGKQVIFSQIRNKSRKHVVGNIYRSIGNNADNGISKVSSVGSFDLSTITDLVANFVNTPYFGLFCVASLIPVYNVVLKKRAEPHKIEGGEFIKKYLAENEDAVLTKSGLVYHEMLRGTGTTQPKASSTVKVHYTGKLINGDVFDSSVERGTPISFPLNGVIPGWTQGLSFMKKNGKARLVIPSDLGYGDKGSSPAIPPGATLIFDIQLLDIK